MTCQAMETGSLKGNEKRGWIQVVDSVRRLLTQKRRWCLVGPAGSLVVLTIIGQRQRKVRIFTDTM